MIEHAGTCSIDTISEHELRFASAKGGCVYSESGQKYYDFILGFGPVVIGHADPEFNGIVTSYISNGIHFPSYSTFHEELVEPFADTEWSSVSFFKTSSESVTAAIRIAMHATKRKEIIRCGFLGWHDAEIAATGSWHEPPGSKFRSSLRFNENFRGVNGDEATHNWYDFDLEELEKMLRSEKIAVFLIDAYQLYFCDADTVRRAFRLCNRYGTMTVLDETKTSGRVAFLGLSRGMGLNPDILVLGKAIANGAPLSILCGKRELSEYAKAARITGTFSKEILSVYCALATKRIMDERNGYEQLRQIGRYLVQLLNDVATEAGVENIVSFKPVFGGSMFNLEFSPSIYEDMETRKKLRLQMAAKGVLILQGHPSFVSLAHKDIDENELRRRVKDTFHEWRM